MRARLCDLECPRPRRAHAHAAHATALTPVKSELRSMLIKRLCGFDRALHLDLEWALDRYERQEGACYYTGVTLILSGPVYTTPFILSFERLDESLGYTRTNTVFIAAEFNSGYGVQMTTDLADLFYGPKREREGDSGSCWASPRRLGISASGVIPAVVGPPPDDSVLAHLE